MVAWLTSLCHSQAACHMVAWLTSLMPGWPFVLLK
jgi:hypothetical protein